MAASTFAFVFTDIEGSTRLLSSLGNDPYERMLDRHREIITTASGGYGGHIVRAEGDGCFLAFPTATDALSACVAAQLELRRDLADVRVRMGIHSGEARPTPDGDYVGLAVHHAARVGDAANGGQIILSDAAATLAQPLPEFVALDDLGSFHLRDLEREVRLFRVVHPDLPNDDRLPRASSGVVHNLPIIRTSFIGRTDEMKEITKLVALRPLVTITGTGGIGKTRLAIEAASASTGAFADGAWLIELAPITDASLVGTRVADALSLPEDPGRADFARIASELRDKQTLLILDNCEHVIGAAAGLVDTILRACERVTILATSREPLRVRGEALWRLPSLSVPREDETDTIGEAESVRLFCDRAALVAGSFVLDAPEAPIVAHICRRLDGIPLAIELAAARAGALDLDDIGASLDSRFDALQSGYRTDLPRQQTLRAAIDWSYDLLSDDEKRIFRRMSVFRGGAKTHAIAWVCNDNTDALSVISSLIDRSLVQPTDDRYDMLETIHAYAAERLEEADETPALRERHREYYIRFAKYRENGEEEDHHVIERLYSEIDNYRASLEFRVDGDSLEIANDLSLVWFRHGLLEEGRRWIVSALDANPTPSDARSSALGGLANINISLGLFEEGEAAQDEALAWHREHGSEKVILEAVYGRAEMSLALGKVEEARVYLDEALELAQHYGDEGIIGQVHYSLAYLAQADGRLVIAAEHAAHARDHFRSERLSYFEASALMIVGQVAAARGRSEEAREALDAALAMADELDDRSTRAWLSWTLGVLELHVGNNDAAIAAFEAGLKDAEDARDVIAELIAIDLAFARSGADPGEKTLAALDRAAEAATDHPSGPSHGNLRRAEARLLSGQTASVLELARLAAHGCLANGARPEAVHAVWIAAIASNDYAAAVRLLAFVESERAREDALPSPTAGERQDALLEAARESLGDKAFDVSWKAGESLTLDEAVAQL